VAVPVSNDVFYSTPRRRVKALCAGTLDKLDAGTPEFEKLLAEFIRAGREHIDYEESHVWPGLRATLTEEQAQDLGRKLEAGKMAAPTRPHPRTPASPGALKTAGPAAAADKLRDAVTGRGTD
jgi:hypothetical protein